MTNRAFRVKVQLDVHAVTCPGVWLCPNGKVILRINTLDSYAESQRQSPIFPLLFHDKFTFDKIFARRRSLAELQSALEEEFLYAELIQWTTPASRGIILATFETNLIDLLYPTPSFEGLLAGVDVDLLMEPTKYFPGIIAPKIEVSTKTIVEEILGSYDTSMSKSYVINPKMIYSKQTISGQRKKPIKGIIRQRRVCHAKPRSQSCRPYRQRSSECHQFSCPASHQAGSQIHDQCYHFMRKNSICTCRSDFPKLAESTVVIRDNTHVTDNCPVCFKYNCYFPKCHDDSDIIKRYGGIDTKQRYCRKVADICRKFDTQEEAATPLLQSKQSKIENLQETNEKCVVECNPRYEYVGDYSPGRGFYKNLEKFYKRMYKQAKMRARETDV